MSGREIKFRFYSNIEKKMYENMGLIGLNTTYDKNPCIYSADKVVKEDGATRCQYLKDGHLMQFTGLHDNKRTEEYPGGQEIFEGDVFPNHFNSKILGVVRFGEYANMGDDNHGGHVGFFIEWGNDDMLRKDLAYWAKVSSVIGNIYENHELMGSKV